MRMVWALPRKILSSVFTEDWSKIMICAYYLVSEGRALCHTDKWKESDAVPFTGSLESQRITELIWRITHTLQQNFFCKWISHNQQDAYYAIDITSASSYINLNEAEQMDWKGHLFYAYV